MLKINDFRKYWWIPVLIFILIFSYYIRSVNVIPDRILSFDPVFQYRFTKYFVDYGRIPSWDEMSYYTGRPTLKEDYPPFMWYITGWLYMLFGSGMSLLTFVSYMSAIYGAIIIIPTFLLVRELSNEHGGLMAAAFMGTAPQILIRTFGSSYDNDQIVLFFILLTLYLGVYALKKRSLISFNLLLIGFVGFMLSWGFYFYSFVILIAMLVFHIIFSLVLNRKENKIKILNDFKKPILIFVGLFIALVIIGYLVEMNVIKTFFDLLGFAQSPEQWIVNVSIAELQLVGDLWIPILAIVLSSIVFSYFIFKFFLKKRQDEEILFPIVILITTVILTVAAVIEHFKNGATTTFTESFLGFLSSVTLPMGRFFIGNLEVDTFLAIFSFSLISFVILISFYKKDWFKFSAVLALFSIGLYSSFRGIRFTEFTSALFMLLMGAGLGSFIETINKKGVFVKILTCGIILILGLFVFLIGLQLSQSLGPDINSNWDDAWNFLKTKTPEFSIVGTWWDPGHMISGTAERRDYADGGHCHTCLYTINDRIVDLGKIMVTSDENVSLDLIRKYQGDSPKVYWIASDDLIGKFQWLQYFGIGCDARTDSKCPLYMQIPENNRYLDNNGNIVIRNYNIGKDLNVMIFNGPIPVPILVQGIDAALFDDFIVYNGSQPVSIRLGEGERNDLINSLKPLERNLNVRFTNQTIPMTAWIQSQFSYVVLIPPNLRESVFTKMFMLEGQGLEHFKQVFRNEQVKIYEVI